MKYYFYYSINKCVHVLCLECLSCHHTDSMLFLKKECCDSAQSLQIKTVRHINAQIKIEDLLYVSEQAISVLRIWNSTTVTTVLATKQPNVTSINNNGVALYAACLLFINNKYIALRFWCFCLLSEDQQTEQSHEALSYCLRVSYLFNVPKCLFIVFFLLLTALDNMTTFSYEWLDF